LAASRQLGTINYAVEGSGPDHARTFEAVLRIGGTDYGSGAGNSKKEAEQEAAADAWRRLTSPAAAQPVAQSPASPTFPAGAPSETVTPKTQTAS
ncbi:MAG TPA: putative dsRNA-binding protein, partial [Arthrobacter sp.]|nr:putative dsRNA-binding protein [Arthrobacter sp.]